MNDLPKGWEVVELGKCVNILDAQRIPVNNDERQERIKNKKISELFPYYGATGQVGWIDDYIFDEDLIALGEDGVPFFDPMKHKAYKITGKSWVNNHAHILNSIDGVSINHFILHFLNYFDYHGYVNGGTRLKLTQANMRKIPIPLPPLAEQTQIATLLDNHLNQLDQIKEKLTNILPIIKQFRQSVLVQAVSGKLIGLQDKFEQLEVIKLESLILKSGNGISKRQGENGKDVTVLRLADFKDAQRVYGNERQIILTEKEITQYKLNQDDILVIRVNGSVDLAGKFILYSNNKSDEAYCDHFIRLKLDTDKILPKYMLYLANFGNGREYLKNSLSTSAGQNTINQTSIKNMSLKIPPLAEQTQIVQQVEHYFAKADQLENHIKSALENINHMTQSLLHQAFIGNLTKEWRA